MNAQSPHDDHPTANTHGNISSDKQPNSLVFPCNTCGTSNRSFAIHCTQCGQLLRKPENWSMAHMNSQRLPTLRKIIALPTHYGFCDTPISLTNGKNSDTIPGGLLPSMLTADSFLIFPNPYTKCLQVHNVVDPTRPKIREIPIQFELGLAQTPVFWGGHLYYAKPGGIFSVSLIDVHKSPTDLRGGDAINPVPGCAPIGASLAEGRPLIVFGLSKSILLYSPFANPSCREIPYDIHPPDRIRSPVYFLGHLVFTTERGKLLDLDLSTGKPPTPYDSKQYFYSAPVVANGQICFEAVDNTGARHVGRYRPGEGSPVFQPLIANESRGAERYPKYPDDFLAVPPLSDGTRLILSDLFGETLYLYTVSTYPHDGGIQLRQLPPDVPGQVTPPRSVIIQGTIYATSLSGITIYNLNTDQISVQPLLVKSTRDEPISSPICYGDKLFVLCKRNLFCIQI